jgi:NitT/TauT family transport system substrate-binding protein
MSLGLAACGGSGGETAATGDTTTVTVGVIPILDVAPVYLGITQGFFEEENLKLKLETAQGGAAIVPGVMSDQYQFGFSNTASLLLAGSRGLGLQAVAAGVSSTGARGKDYGGVVVKGDSGITSPADLAGRKIAVNTLQNINTITVNEAVRAAGGDPSHIEYVELAFPDIAPAVAKGDVDAGQLVEPFLTIAQGQGERQITSNYAETDPDLLVGMYFTSDRYAKRNPKVVEAFGAALKKCMAYAQEHPDEVRAILSTYTDIAADVQKDAVLPSWPTEIRIRSVEKIADLMVEDDLADSTPDVRSLLP